MIGAGGSLSPLIETGSPPAYSISTYSGLSGASSCATVGRHLLYGGPRHGSSRRPPLSLTLSMVRSIELGVSGVTGMGIFFSLAYAIMSAPPWNEQSGPSRHDRVRQRKENS